MSTTGTVPPGPGEPPWPDLDAPPPDDADCPSDLSDELCDFDESGADFDALQPSAPAPPTQSAPTPPPVPEPAPPAATIAAPEQTAVILQFPPKGSAPAGQPGDPDDAERDRLIAEHLERVKADPPVAQDPPFIRLCALLDPTSIALGRVHHKLKEYGALLVPWKSAVTQERGQITARRAAAQRQASFPRRSSACRDPRAPAPATS
jgi:hypothetical protein